MTLPNFLIIGVAKAGTTSLFRYLDQHPQVFMCPIKGTNYFGYEDAINWKWSDQADPPLLQHFKARTLKEYEAYFSEASDEIAIGEATGQYFRCPTAARRIHNTIPDVKLIASLRNPADRAFSGFMMRKRRGEPVKSLYDELTPKAGHVREGFYFNHVKRYFDIFSENQIRIYIFEKFKKDPSKTVIDIFDFLGVDSSFVPNTSTRYNPGGVPRNRHLNRIFYDPTMIRTAKSILPESALGVVKRIRQRNLKTPPTFPADLRADLLDYYREDIHKLEDLLDQDLSIWLNGA